MMLTSIVLAALVSTGAAQPSGQVDELGWHIVRPGDTLEKITHFYLGSTELWRENWKLNPALSDPNKLRIGESLQVILERQLPARTAEVTRISRRVEHKPQPEPWMNAAVGSMLKERDGLRTFQSSSAELRFEDDSRLTITEESLVFLREMTATVGGTNRESIEIVEGQAEVEARPESRGSSNIEILVGGASARPRREATGIARTRARRQTNGGASVMVYGGDAEVAAGGASVQVATGMGTAVPDGGVPSPPEPLLPAPIPQGPPGGSTWELANPPFRWDSIDGAASYTLELCADAGCGLLVERATDIETSEWIPESLPIGDYHWRVTAVSRSGLDGFPSTSRIVSVTAARRDVAPPVVVAVIQGSGVMTAGADGTMSLGRGAVITLDSHDDASGVAAVRYRWNDRPWQDYSRAIEPPDTPSESNRLEVSATDRWGRESKSWSVEVARDETAPPPPAVSVRPSGAPE